MNSSFKSVQILIDLLMQYQIKDIVLSPGGSDIPLIHSIETNDFFNCYSVVDERSAAYFAMGVAQQKNRPVACVCTSGTAVCNFVPGITEAFYQNAPVLAITADKNPYYQGQLEMQKIEQMTMFEGIVNKNVNLPLINSPTDEWLCNRLINEALLALTHHGCGPVHINIPIVGRTDIYNNDILKKERKINIFDLFSDQSNWEDFANTIKSKKRIMFVIGQNMTFSESEILLFENFYKKCNCIYSVEHLSNLRCEGCVNTYPISEMQSSPGLRKLCPDLVISIGNNLSAYNLKPFLRSYHDKIENWLINSNGEIRDSYMCLSTVFEMPVSFFFEKLLVLLKDSDLSGKYFHDWNAELKNLSYPDYPFSSLYVAKKLSSIIPANSILHLAILNSTRIMQHFPLATNVRCYSNVGALGIDGCLSTFAGQAAATNELAYLVIGDLSFFYDMNAAGLRSIDNNVRIILLNNCGGAEFHFFIGKDKISSINDYISAEHSNIAAGWALSLGYEYYYATTKDEFDDAIEKFSSVSDKPLFLEVFTDMENDAKILKDLYSKNEVKDTKSFVKKAIKRIFSDNTIEKIRRALKK